jgi:hypothetical protein
MVDVKQYTADLIRERRRVHVTYCTSRCDWAKVLEELAREVENMRVPLKG